jgi:multiple sugar transport system substrate-binding protein
VQDISIFDAPQRAMAEALSKSPQFDFIHIDSNMIPSLASAGYLEPLDEYMKEAGYKMDAVGDYGQLATYDGKTYGIITDGNIFVHQLRKDLFEDADNKKKFEDKFGKPLAYPQTWDDEFQQMKLFHNPEKGIYGSGNLRSRGFGYVWFLMYLYSFGGFPFDTDMKPTVSSEAGNRAMEVYLRDKEVAFPDSPSWGTSQMIPHIAAGDVFSCQYWGGLIKLQEIPRNRKRWASGPTGSSRPVRQTTSRCIGRRACRWSCSPSTAIARARQRPLTWRAGWVPKRPAPRSSRTASTPSMTPGPSGR